MFLSYLMSLASGTSEDINSPSYSNRNSSLATSLYVNIPKPEWKKKKKKHEWKRNKKVKISQSYVLLTATKSFLNVS